MPFAVFKSIREVSSEDKVHCAANLLKNEPAKKWKTEECDEKSAFVIIEMDQAYTIKGIDIGNEGSAFVEVLVGGPGCAREKFKELLITCSFMTPIESRNSTNLNRVRCFGREALVEEIANQKWQLLKIVCSQPFNKHTQYGLSFIKIHVDGPQRKGSIESNGISISKPVGSFTLREDSSDSESESKTALFNRWKISKNKNTNGISSVPRVPSPASLKKPNESFSFKKAIAVPSASVEKTTSEDTVTVRDRNRDSLLYNDDDEKDSIEDKHKKRLERLEKVIVADQERVTKENNKSKKPTRHDTSKDESKSSEKQKKPEVKSSEKTNPKENVTKKSPSKDRKLSTPSTSGHRRPSSSPCTSDKPKKPKLDKNIQYKPFDQLLRGVVLVISGIQNPDRSNLRNKALALGAKYKVDWDNSSTHLICAFKNTPKYNQVKGVGKIVTKSWIEDCHSQKKRLAWRRYALDTAELNKPESDDEIFDESLKPKENNTSKSRIDSEDDDAVLEIYDNNASHAETISSGSDTEDEIEKVLASVSSRKKPSPTQDIFEVSTEEEDYIPKKKRNVSSNGSSFFEHYKFYVSDKLSATDKIKVERCIETYNGNLTNSLDDANYAIANEPVCDKVFKGETVAPLWIFECNDTECLIPPKRYLVL